MERSIRPTKRGVALVAIAAVAFAIGAISGARSLNAVVVPALVALGAGLVQLRLADAPTIERTTPEPAFPGGSRTITVSVDSAVPCVVDERIADGLGTEPRLQAVGHGGSFQYDVALTSRGAYDLGPAICKQTDSFGLFSRFVTLDRTATVVVYPEIYALDEGAAAGILRDRLGEGRGSFDRLREYTSADAMRDIHWRASARRPPGEFLVTEYEHHAAADRITVVAEAEPGGVDSMAAAVASVVYALSESGIAVEVRLPDAEVRCHPGEMTAVLWALAHTDGGTVEDDGGADVRIVGKPETTTIAAVDREVDFEPAALEEPTEVAI